MFLAQLVMVAVQVVILAAVLDVAKQENAVVHPLYIAPKQEANAAALWEPAVLVGIAVGALVAIQMVVNAAQMETTVRLAIIVILSMVSTPVVRIRNAPRMFPME